MRSLKKLFSSIKIGGMEVKNRIVMAPMGTDGATDDETISQKQINYYEARAKGGVGLIISEVSTVDPLSPYQVHNVGLWDDKFIPGFRRLVEAVHAYGAKVAPQILHPGPESLSFRSGIQPAGPSAVMAHTTKQMCRELTLDEIEKIVEQFGEAARRASEAGCDGLELHAAHNYCLVGSFLSSLRNKRTDAYGGSVEGRLKLLLEVIKSIRAKAGPDFPIILRISGDELVPGGRTIRQTQYIAPILAEAGVHAFDVSAGVVPQLFWRVVPPTGTPLGLHTAFSAAVKEVVDVPVMAVGRINDPLLAEDILDRGEADLVVMGRALLADPELPNKAAAGKFEDIAPCIGCSLGCIGRMMALQPLSCTVNPAVGREKEMAITPAAKRKKVLVAGGGPGGLEAARVAALRGNQVTLCEKEAKLGGQFNLAAVPPMKQELCNLVKYLSRQVEKAGVRVELNKEVTPKLVEELEPDAFIVATGGAPLIPDLPGIRGDRVVSAYDVLAGKVAPPSGNVLVIGGGMVGLEVSEFLANPGDNPVMGCTNVTIVEMLEDVGLDMAGESRTLLMQRLRENGVKIVTSARVKEVLEDGVVAIKDGQDGQQETTILGMDHIVLAMGARPVDQLSKKIRDKVAEVYVIGDAKEPRKALEAIAEGAEAGRKI
jgi:2,4-dienoyl-CoA reductase-like NADH-dependent reductase (Old Yellow Enzyme family)/thioredoxin reductase